MNWLQDYFDEMAFLVTEAAPYLLVGFVLAGLLKVFLPKGKVYAQLGKPNLRSSLLASLYGLPLPLCSCSVIPTAAELKRSGASKGATASFLISTPETGVDSISVTWALMDPIMTVVRPVTAFVTAVLTGGVVNFLVRRKWDRGPKDVDEDQALAELTARGHQHGEESQSCAEQGGSCACHDEPAPGPRQKLREGLRYAFGPLLDDLVPWLILGLLVSGLISTLIPDNLFTEIVPRGWPALLLMLVLGTPMYICATASTPIAVTLIAKGMEPGAALVFLLVGPATNFTTLLVVTKLLGRRVLAVYLVSITGVALLAGIIINGFYLREGLDLSAVVSQKMAAETGPIAAVTGIAFTLMMIASARRIGLLGQWAGSLRRACAPLGLDPTGKLGRGVLIGALILVYGSTALTVVQPGESGWVLRFGRISKELNGPGMYGHLPWPLESTRIVRPDQVRAVANGQLEEVPLDSGANWRQAVEAELRVEDELEMLCGDEALLSIAFSVHYSPRDARRVTFELRDPDALVFGLAEGALRRVVAKRHSSDILVRDRREIEAEAIVTLQAELDAVEAGIRVHDVLLSEVHAPKGVHRAYRDVASAQEDKSRYLHDAEGFRAEHLTDARYEVYAEGNLAVAEAAAAVAGATGEAQAFEEYLAAYAEAPSLVRLRLRLEALGRALARTRNVVLLGDDVELDVYSLGEGATPPAGVLSEDR